MIRTVALALVLTVPAFAAPKPTELRGALKQTVGKLEGVVNEVQEHAADADKIKHAIAEKQSQLRVAKHKHNMLTDNVEHLEKTHAHLAKSLHKVHDAELSAAHNHLKKEEADLQKKSEEKKHWEEEVAKDSAEEETAVKDEEAADRALKELQSKEELQKQQEEAAESKFQYSSQMAKEEAQSLKLAEDKYNEELSRLKKAQDVEKEVEGRNAREDANIRDMQEVEDAKRDVRAEQDDADDKKENFEDIKKKSAELNEELATAANNFQESKAQLSKTQQETATAAKDSMAKKSTAEKIIETRKKAEDMVATLTAKVNLAMAGREAAEQSVQRLDAIRAKEEEELETHIAKGKKNLEEKLKVTDDSRDKTATDINDLQKQYGNWQGDQLERVQKVKAVKETVQSVSKDYTESLKEARAHLPKKAHK